MQINHILLIAAVLFVIVFPFTFYQKMENFFIFFPDSNLDASPENWHLPYEDVYFESEDQVKLHGWYFPGQNASDVVLFCHGNAGNISHRLDNVRRLLAHGLAVFIFDYRGYGKSSGKPSESGLYRDGLAAYDYMIRKKGIQPEHIIPFGRSLGSAVAIEIALNRPVKSLIIESPFTSTKGMAKTMLLFSLFSFIIPAHYNNLGKIPQIAVPLLVMHGDRDDIVPFSMGEKIYQAARHPKFFHAIRGAGHNDTYYVGGRAYFRIFSSFAKNKRL
jgi:fermentation-respiration switch protein FrsA (DUF1100 family)